MGKRGRPKISDELLAQILAFAAVNGDKAALSKFEISASTLDRARKSLPDRPELRAHLSRALVAQTKTPADMRAVVDAANRLTLTLLEAMADPHAASMIASNPDLLAGTTDLVRMIHETSQTYAILHARLTPAGQNGNTPQGALSPGDGNVVEGELLGEY